MSIHFPRQEKFGNRKDGKNSYSQFSIKISNEKISEAIKRALIRAKESMEQLGMTDVLIKNKFWENPPIPSHLTKKSGQDNIEKDEDEEDDNEDDDNEDVEKIEKTSDNKGIADLFVSSAEDGENLVEDIKKLCENKAMADKVKDKAEKMINMLVKAIGINTGIPIFKKKESGQDSKEVDDVASVFVKVKMDGKQEEIYIRKRTAVWLFQDGERLSADRLFRVRAKQPFTVGNIVNQKMIQKDNLHTAIIGDLCAFKYENNNFRIGRVLQFAKYDKSKQSSYQGNFAEIDCKFGVLCTWYEMTDGSQSQFTISSSSNTTYYPLNTYICTLTNNCLLNHSLTCSDLFKHQIITSTNEFTLTKQCADFIHDSLKTSSNVKDTTVTGTLTSDSTSYRHSHQWTKCGSVILYQTEKTALLNGKSLSDMHINVSQQLLLGQFSHLGGLQSTLYQLKEPIKNSRNPTRNLGIQQGILGIQQGI